MTKHDSDFRSLVENNPDIILRVDHQLRCTYANAAFIQLARKPLTELVGKTHVEFGVSEVASQQINSALQAVFEQKKELRAEFEYSFDIERCAIEARIVPEFIGDQHDVVESVLLIGRDISEHKIHGELQARHNQAEILRRFMEKAAHDLITPLTTMKTNLYLMQRTTEDPAQLRRIELLEDQTEHIQKSMNALLKMIRLDDSHFDFEETDLNQLVQDVIITQYDLMKVKKQDIEFHPDEKLSPLLLDPHEIQYVVRELIMNAVAHSAAGATTHVETRLGRGEVMIMVRDEGEGIAPYDLAHIFEPFYRAAAREVVKGGMGLGLTLCRLIINAHSGHMEVQSQLDHGSTFFIYLPIIKDQADLRKKRTTQQFQIPVTRGKST